MSSKGGRRHIKSRNRGNRPSLLFMIALGVGLLFFFWILMQVVTNKQPEEKPLGAIAISEPLRSA